MTARTAAVSHAVKPAALMPTCQNLTGRRVRRSTLTCSRSNNGPTNSYAERCPHDRRTADPARFRARLVAARHARTRPAPSSSRRLRAPGAAVERSPERAEAVSVCGTISGYSGGCRCDRCRRAWAMYYTERRRNDPAVRELHRASNNAMGCRESSARRMARGRCAADPVRRRTPRMVRRAVHHAEDSAGEVRRRRPYRVYVPREQGAWQIRCYATADAARRAARAVRGAWQPPLRRLS